MLWGYDYKSTSGDTEDKRTLAGYPSLAGNKFCSGMSGKNSNCVDHLLSFTNPMNKGCYNNVVHEKVPSGVGIKGGLCRCPDGEEYWVGEDEAAFGTLACVNGNSEDGITHNWTGEWSGRRVICSLEPYERVYYDSNLLEYFCQLKNPPIDDPTWVDLTQYGTIFKANEVQFPTQDDGDIVKEFFMTQDDLIKNLECEYMKIYSLPIFMTGDFDNRSVPFQCQSNPPETFTDQNYEIGKYSFDTGLFRLPETQTQRFTFAGEAVDKIPYRSSICNFNCRWLEMLNANFQLCDVESDRYPYLRAINTTHHDCGLYVMPEDPAFGEPEFTTSSCYVRPRYYNPIDTDLEPSRASRTCLSCKSSKPPIKTPPSELEANAYAANCLCPDGNNYLAWTNDAACTRYTCIKGTMTKCLGDGWKTESSSLWFGTDETAFKIECFNPYLKRKDAGLTDNSIDPNVYRIDEYSCYDGDGCRDRDDVNLFCYDCRDLGVPINRSFPDLLCRKCEHKFFNEWDKRWECLDRCTKDSKFHFDEDTKECKSCLGIKAECQL